jgi:hypothetical protein
MLHDDLMLKQPTESAPEPERVVLETGYRLRGPFLSFYEHYGPVLCGLPVSEERVEDGLPCQYFQCLALEEHLPGRVRLKRLGEAWLAIGAPLAAAAAPATLAVDLTGKLLRHPQLNYPTRPLADIRYLVIHHTGTGPDFGPTQIAEEHVTGNGWPGIGYHFVVGPEGALYRTQDLSVVSHHARQFNPAAVGIALMGNLAQSEPPPAQLAATADVVAGLLADLGLPLDALRGHGEMVSTDCPGERFLGGWKLALERAALARLARLPAADGVAA